MEDVIVRQLDAALLGVPEDVSKPVLVAYEPVWAIGTGKTATAEDVAEAHGILRRRLKEVRGDGFAHEVAILYGGSVKPDNAAELLAITDVDGVLVGGASLDPESFARIAEACLTARVCGLTLQSDTATFSHYSKPWAVGDSCTVSCWRS